MVIASGCITGAHQVRKIDRWVEIAGKQVIDDAILPPSLASHFSSTLS